MHILLVEDNDLLGDGVRTAFTQLGYLVDWIKDGQLALQVILTQTFDVIILDLGLPKRSGLEILKIMRSKNLNTPVLILTANDTLPSRILGLDTGADDYLVKPFDLPELSARVRALHRRFSSQTSSTISHGRVTLDVGAHDALVDDKPVALSRREFMLLQKLFENIGRVLSRDQLNQSLYSWDDEIDSNALEVHIHNLRRKLSFPLIRTVRGVGYMIDKTT